MALKASFDAASWAGRVGSSSAAAISSVVAWVKQSSQVARLSSAVRMGGPKVRQRMGRAS